MRPPCEGENGCERRIWQGTKKGAKLTLSPFHSICSYSKRQKPANFKDKADEKVITSALDGASRLDYLIIKICNVPYRDESVKDPFLVARGSDVKRIEAAAT